MTAALYYAPEAYSTQGPQLMGRHAAGASFLRGFLSHSRTEAFWLQVDQLASAHSFVEAAQAAGRTEPVFAVTAKNLASLANVGTVFYPGPSLSPYAWQRAADGHGLWSLCGITHTTSSAGAMDALTDLLTAPIYPWDALICTSTAVKDNVTRVLQAQADYLAQRLGIQKLVLPQLPVIPLGIHTQDFSYTSAQKIAARHTLGVDAQTLVVLFMGRLSFHAKAHPLAMYQALEKAAQTTGQSIVLVECGWHANEPIRHAYHEAAQLACPSVRVVTLDGRNAADRQTAWASADVFCSLSDNIQETFGIAPIEAMAAGLPVIVSDWDGYKDTVREGVDGFRIPTLMPPAGLGQDLALRHALNIDSYDMYCGHSSSLVAVDVAQTAQAFIQLFSSPTLRQRMGASGKQRAQTVYDWACIIPQYEALWAQLKEIRHRQAPSLPALAHPWPARMDPFHAFATYPSGTLHLDTVVGLADTELATALHRITQYRQLTMVAVAKAVLPDDSEWRLLLETLALGPQTPQALIQLIAPKRQAFVFRGLVWLLKMGVITVLEP